jgi:hypothetical protein
MTTTTTTAIHEKLWAEYERDALFARKHGSYSKAARILREAFREAEEFGEIYDGLVTQAHALADAYLDNQRYCEAESLFRMVLEAREKLLGQTHDDVVESLKKVAIVQIMSFRAEALGRSGGRSPLPWVENVAAAS